MRTIGLIALVAALAAAALAAPAHAVTLVAPGDGASFPNPSPVLRWQLDRGERVRVARVYRSDGRLAYSTDEWQDAPKDRDTSYHLNALLPAGTYTWTVRVTNLFGESVTSEPRSFTTDPPHLGQFAVTAKHDRANRRSTFAITQSPAWAAIDRRIYWQGKRVSRVLYHPFPQTSEPLEPAFRWSCKRIGLYGWRVTARDAYGGRIERRGTFTVPRCKS